MKPKITVTDTHLFVHVSLPSHDSSREQPENLIEFGGLDFGGPNLVVLVAKKDMALGTNNELEVLEKMNERVGEEYKGMGDVASRLRVFVEQLKSKGGNFDQYAQQIDAIEQQVTKFEVVVSMLDKHVSLLESKVLFVYQSPPSHLPPTS
ncbi:hypothetical protein SO802_001047 [Lithocarpus litseifolius]|uniref:Uncharacterized protein n=1 Tax=Lithocarpus litseifolius TaxID=425828 RepID=A0AAW2DWQ8_9ROSI